MALTISFSRLPGAFALLVLFAACAVTSELPEAAKVKATLQSIVKEKNGGFGTNMWATIVDREGLVRVVTFSGDHWDDQWPGSRLISAEKANSANAFSLPKLAVSTAQLFSAVQPGGSLFGLQFANPVNDVIANAGKAKKFGTTDDPMIGERIGGVIVFGGGLALYNSDGTVIGGLGLSGDSAVSDHIIAWKLRHALDLDHIPGGVSPTGDDNMAIDITDGKSASGWGHPATSPEATELVKNLPTTHPIPKNK